MADPLQERRDWQSGRIIVQVAGKRFETGAGQIIAAARLLIKAADG
jgi:hypothetical protein